MDKQCLKSHETGYNTILTSFVVMGILLLWSGLNGIVQGTSNSGPDPYCMSKGILSVLLLFLSIVCFHRGQQISCMVMLMTALFFLVRTFGGFLSDMHDVGIVDIVLSIPILTCAAVLFMAGNRSVGVAMALAGSAFMIEGMHPSIISDSIMAVSGSMFIIIGLSGFVMMRRIDPMAIDSSIGTALMVIPGTMMMGIIGLVVAASPVGPTLYAVATGMSVIMIAMSLMMLNRGILLMGTIFLMYGFSCIMLFVPPAMGLDVLAFGSIFCIPVMVCGTILMKKDMTFGSMMLLFGFIVLLSALEGSETICRVAYAVVGVGGLSKAMLSAAGVLKTDSEQYIDDGCSSPSQVVVTGGFAISCMMLLVSANIAYAHISNVVDDSPLDIAIVISSVLVMVMSVIAARTQMVTESIVFMISGSSVMIFSVADITFMNDGLSMVSVFMTLGILTGAFISYVHGDRLHCTAVVVLAISLLVLPMGSAAVSFPACLLSGTLFMVLSAERAVVLASCTDAVREIGDTQSDPQYAITLMKTLGILLIALLCIMYDLNTMGGEQYMGLEVTRIIICSILIALGTYVTSKGLGPAGAFIIITSGFGFTSSLMNVVGFHVPGEFQQIIALALIPVFYSAFMSGDRITFMISSVVFLTFVLNPFLDSGIVFTASDMALRVVSCIIALIAWVQYDTRISFMDSLFKCLNSKGRIRKTSAPDPMRGVWSMGFLMTASACIWFGVSLIASDLSDESVMIPSIILSAIVILFSSCMICKGMFIDGFSIFSAGMMFITMPFTTGSMDPVSSVALLCSAFMALSCKRYPIVVIALALLSSEFATWYIGSDAGGCMFIAFGVLMLIIAAMRLSGYMSSPGGSGSIYNVAMMSAAVVGAVYVMSFQGGSSLSGLTISAMAAIMAFHMIMRGVEAEALYMLSMSMPCIGYSFLNLFGLVEGTAPAMIMGLSTLVTGCIFAHEREYLLCASSAICTVSMLIYVATGSQTVCISCGILFLIITMFEALIPADACRDVATHS